MDCPDFILIVEGITERLGGEFVTGEIVAVSVIVPEN